MNGKLIFLFIVNTITTTTLIISLFFNGQVRAPILFGVLCLSFIAFHITEFLLIDEIAKDKNITIVFNKHTKRETGDNKEVEE
jgi:hypothetical protein